ncbi:RAD55 family ATPase [Rubricoccus marinus]|uniref:KaiC-like domain-containing protein n=1 Tax=Rubricoccus marinus TaxID=716817 RepID=A0A259TWH6_9BACT|nr:ATPase domain-containing protein [Rubricoccus marinus]OZC01898.1 hypothetical protein BSZ36_02180 [Rubricoccus marinus]
MTAASSPPTPSGIAAVDDRWDGLRPGSALLLVGRSGAGRTDLGMAAVRSAVEAGQTCLLLSPRATDALAEAAKAAGVDLAALHKTGRLRVLRIPSGADLAAKGNAGLDSAYRDLGALAVKAGAHRVVIEDFTPLVQYTTFEAFGAAFSGLRKTLADAGAAFLLGLGEPANEASKRLLSVVQTRVDATVRVTSGENGRIVSIDETVMAEPPVPAPKAQAAPEARTTPAPETRAPAAPEARPAAFAPEAPAPEPTAPEPSAAEPPAQPFAPAPFAPAAPEASAEPSPPPMPDAFSLDSAPDPFETAPPAFPSSDGASLPVDEPLAPEASGLEASPDFGETPLPPPAVQETFAPERPSPPSSVMNAGIEIAPPPDPDLLAPIADPFGRDPGGTFFDNGYLVDSKGAATIPVTSVHQEAYPEVFTPPTQEPEPLAPMPPPTMPSFASIPAAPAQDNGRAATRQALDSAFAARDYGTPFLIVAARMERSQPESVSFETVTDGLRAALPSGGTLYADSARLRSLLVLPGADASGAQQIFATLQQHLQKHLGQQAEATLQAVAAITVPDGQPFGSAEELWNYAVES